MKMCTPHLGRAPQLHKCQMNGNPMESQVRKKGKKVGGGGDQPFFPSCSRGPFSAGSIGSAGSSGYGASVGSAANPGYSGSAATPGYMGSAATTSGYARSLD